jgi:hypothetical protein
LVGKLAASGNNVYDWVDPRPALNYTGWRYNLLQEGLDLNRRCKENSRWKKSNTEAAWKVDEELFVQSASSAKVVSMARQTPLIISECNKVQAAMANRAKFGACMMATVGVVVVVVAPVVEATA